jgi:AbrB family looped-hinge helix DNA binding protein
VHAELVRGVVHPRPAVQQQQRGPLHHLPVDRHEPEPVDVHVDPDPTTDVDAHVVDRTHRSPTRNRTYNEFVDRYSEAMNGATYKTAVMKISRNGQISIPADVRKRWNTDRVIVMDTSDGLIVRPFDPEAVTKLMGKYQHLVTETSDEMRRAIREEQAEREDERDRARRLRG